MRGPYDFQTSIDPSKYYTLKVKKRWYRTDIGQKVRTPLPFTMHKTEVWDCAPGRNLGWVSSGFWSQSCPPYLLVNGGDGQEEYPSNVAAEMTVAVNRAVRKFQDKARSTMQLGADFAERRKTFQLVTKAFTGMRNPARVLATEAQRVAAKLRKKKNGNAGSPAEQLYLGQVIDPRWTSRSQSEQAIKALSKEAGNAWLAWHFGIKPLMGEVKTALELWEKTRPVSQLIIAASGFDSTRTYVPGFPKTDYYQAFRESKSRYRCVARVSAVVEEVNPFTVTLDQLGILNPFSIALELTPYSFIWGSWLYPIDLYVNSMFGFMPGYRLVNGYTTRYVQGKHEIKSWNKTTVDPMANYPNRTRTWYVDRQLGVSPVIQKRLNPWSSSFERFATASSLLVKIFKF